MRQIVATVANGDAQCKDARGFFFFFLFFTYIYIQEMGERGLSVDDGEGIHFLATRPRAHLAETFAPCLLGIPEAAFEGGELGVGDQQSSDSSLLARDVLPDCPTVQDSLREPSSG